MQRTISVMVGKGSVSHNSREFNASNTDPERSHLNMIYCNTPIKEVYTELFSEAVKRYNEKQTRNDRCIDNYYEKIRSGKQEKPFHEIILQVGNKDDMNAKTENGELAVKILDEYAKDFQDRNPNMQVFSAHLHMDEATPHLHIDFVPFTTGSKRGLDTRVSLKQALAAQGFNGGSRQETEWNQWVLSEKKELAKIMERYDVQWEQKGTHEKHLSVLDFEKKMRSEEITQLETKIETLQVDTQETQKTADKAQKRFEVLEEREEVVGRNVDKYDTDSEWKLPAPKPLQYAQSYKTKIVEPFIRKLKDAIRSLVAQCVSLVEKANQLKKELYNADNKIDNLNDRLEKLNDHNSELTEYAKDYIYVRKSLGEEQTNDILYKAKAEEQALKQKEEEQAKAEKAAKQALKRTSRSKNYYER